MRTTTFLAVSLGAATGLASFAAAAQTELNLWTWRQQEIPLWEAVDEKFPDITINVETTRPTEYDARLRIAMQSEGPDIIQGRAGAGWIDPYATAGAFAPLEDLVNPEMFPQVALDLVKGSDGVIYGVPFAFQTTHFMYNEALFERLGLEEPQTWEEFYALLETLKENGVAPMYAPGREAWALNITAGILDASMLRNDFIKALQEGEACFTDPEYVAVLERLESFVPYFQEGFSGNTTDDMVAALALEQAGIVGYGIFGIGLMKEINPEMEVGLFLAPTGDPSLEPLVFAYPDGGYYMNAATEHPEAVRQVLEFTQTEEFGQMFVDLVGEITAVRGDYTVANNSALQEAIGFLNERSLDYLTWVRSPFRDGEPSLYEMLASGQQRLYAGETTPEELARTIQDGLNTWYGPYVEKGNCP